VGNRVLAALFTVGARQLRIGNLTMRISWAAE
jgi:hypothetical protein